MTRYDPFAFGQVNLAGEKEAPSTSPDDLLFTDSGGSARNAPPADSSWGLIEADVGSLLPGAKSSAPPGLDFGTEGLGDTMAGMPMPVVAPVRARPAATPRPAPSEPTSTATAPRSTDASSRRQVGTRPVAPAPVVAASAPAGKSPSAPTYVARRPSSVGRIGSRGGLLSLVVPLALFLGGGTAAAWLYAMQQNTPMAAITGALALVATVFSRILLRG